MRVQRSFLFLALLAGCQTPASPVSQPVQAVVAPNTDTVAADDNCQSDIQLVGYQPNELPPVPVALTAEQVVASAIASNPAVQEAAARVRAAGGRWVQAGLRPNLEIGYSASEIGNGGAAGQQGGFVGRQIITGGKLALSQRVADRETAVATQQLAIAQQRVTTDATLAYYSVLIAQRKKDLGSKLVDVSEQSTKVSEQLFQAKEVSESAVLQASIETEQARILQRQAVTEVDAAWRRLAAVSGLSDTARPQLIDGLEAEQSPRMWEATLQYITETSPEMAAAALDLERARAALQRARAEVVPDVNVQVSVQHDKSSHDDIAGVNLSLPVPIANRNQGRIREAEAQVTAAKQRIERIELALKERLAERFSQYEAAYFSVVRFRDQIIPSAERNLDLVRRSYQQGESSYLSLLTAQRTYFQANLGYLENLNRYWKASTEIDGMLLTDSLQQE